VRRTARLLYALLFVNEFQLAGIAPLVPFLERELHLSTFQSGAFLAASSVVQLAAAFPAGVLADRIGPRRLTIAAGVILALGSVTQGLAPDFWTLIAGRAAFGLASTTIWSAGLSWLTDTAGRRKSSALAGTMTTAGLAALVAPAFNGLLAEHMGVAAPFAVIGIAAASLAVALSFAGDSSHAAHPHQSVRTTLAGLRGLVLGGVVLLAFGGLVSSIVNLLVPLQLDDNGVSGGIIGLCWSIAAVAFLAASALVTRSGARAVRLGFGALALLGLAGLLSVLAVSTATPTLVAFLVLRAPLLAVVFTTAYPLGAVGAVHAAIGRGAVMGLMNAAWGVTTTVGPLAGGAIADHVGAGAAFGVVAALTAGAATVLLAGGTRAAARPAHAPARAR
jgi:MFS family permease